MKRRLLLCLLLCLAVSMAGVAEEVTIVNRLTELGYLSDDQQSLVTALRNFQTANNLFPTGTLDDLTADALDSYDAISQYAYLTSFAQRYKDTAAGLLDSHAAIVALQSALRNLGYPLGAADGVYGDATRSAVAQFQLANGLYATGDVDASMLIRLYEGTPISWDTFISQQCCARGDNGAHVKRVQERLARYGYFQGETTGSFGELTQQAVMLFQSANSLTATGEADAATCRALFSNDAQAAYVEGEMRMGDEGDNISTLQRRLAALGYYAGGFEGKFDEPTRNALMLFQLAAGLEVSEYADQATLQAIERNNPVTLEQAEDGFEKGRNRATAEQTEQIVADAEAMQGKPFSVQGDGLFPGFAFVQYLYARAGIAVTDPGAMVQSPTLSPASAEDIPRGAIAILQITRDDSVVFSMGISLGDGRMICAEPDSGWVVCVSIDQMTFSALYACALYDGE